MLEVLIGVDQTLSFLKFMREFLESIDDHVRPSFEDLNLRIFSASSADRLLASVLMVEKEVNLTILLPMFWMCSNVHNLS